jgi:hypothetical protein
MADGLRQRRRGKGIYRRNVLDLAVKGKVVEIGFSRELHSSTLLTYALVGPGLFCFFFF